MTVALGIDTGGTYTHAMSVDHASGEVLAGAKALDYPSRSDAWDRASCGSSHIVGRLSLPV